MYWIKKSKEATNFITVQAVNNSELTDFKGATCCLYLSLLMMPIDAVCDAINSVTVFLWTCPSSFLMVSHNTTRLIIVCMIHSTIFDDYQKNNYLTGVNQHCSECVGTTGC